MMGHEILSFINIYVWYIQIHLVEEDLEKMSFITEDGLCCFVVIPFALKNTGDIYQRSVNKMFKYLINKIIEVYIKDIIVNITKK